MNITVKENPNKKQYTLKELHMSKKSNKDGYMFQLLCEPTIYKSLYRIDYPLDGDNKLLVLNMNTLDVSSVPLNNYIKEIKPREVEINISY